MAKQDKEKKP